jgi:hypothetical protein
MSVSKVWNGSTWVNPFFLYPKIYDGTNWNYGIPKIRQDAQSTDSKVVTVGRISELLEDEEAFGGPGPSTLSAFGYAKNSFGSIDSAASSLYAGWEPLYIRQINYNDRLFDDTGNYAYQRINLSIPDAPNSGWTTMTIDGNSYARASATYSGGYWTWNVTSNPFEASAIVIVTWT